MKVQICAHRGAKPISVYNLKVVQVGGNPASYYVTGTHPDTGCTVLIRFERAEFDMLVRSYNSNTGL